MAQRRVRWWDCLAARKGPSSGGAPSVNSAFAPFAWETSPVLCQ